MYILKNIIVNVTVNIYIHKHWLTIAAMPLEMLGHQVTSYLSVTTGNITLGKIHKYYKCLPLELFRALVVGAKYSPLCQYAKMV